jgi:hypothetical protein
MKKWNGILKIIQIQHLDVDGSVLWEQRNVHNLLHLDGEEYLLRAAFLGGRDSTVIPDNYYLGLDNRTSISVDQTVDDLVGEPVSGGYERQSVSSSGDFGINLEDSHFIVTSPIVAFRATSGPWGPVQNLFLTTAADDSGFLVSTAVLDSPVSLSLSQSVTMRIGITLTGC